MAYILPAAQPLVIGIALNRSRRVFSERDRLLLNLIRPPLIQAYQGAEVVTQMSRQTGLALQGLEQLDRAVIFVTRQGRVLQMTSRVQQILVKYFPDSLSTTPSIPEILQRWVRHQVDG